ncbi:MAG: hypothetical protein K1X55_17480 [Chitinophagales bacterium]|nr:hypothetical protein [Chitinophagales bacterium]
MLTIRTNIGIIGPEILSRIELLRNPSEQLKIVANDVLVLINERIHEKGLAADETKIGTYSSQYLKFRGDNGRGGKTDVFLSFTRQLQNSLDVVQTENGWGIGIINDSRLPMDNFLNKKNKAKGKTRKNGVTNSELIKYLEDKYKKKIWSLTPGEINYAVNKLNALIKADLHG